MFNQANVKSQPEGEFSLPQARAGEKLTFVALDFQSIPRGSAVRLMELGFTPGIEIEFVGQTNGLLRVKVRSAELSMRPELADAIKVRRCS